MLYQLQVELDLTHTNLDYPYKREIVTKQLAERLAVELLDYIPPVDAIATKPWNTRLECNLHVYTDAEMTDIIEVLRAARNREGMEINYDLMKLVDTIYWHLNGKK